MIQIKVANLEKKFESNGSTISVISSFNYEFVQGRVYLIKADSGVGKSTLLHLIGGLDVPTNGTISISPQAALPGVLFGFVFQDHNLLPEFSVEENLKLPLLAQGCSSNFINNRIDELLARFDLINLKNHYPNQLSGGQRQRVAVIRAAIAQPSFILADEPTASLDEKNSLLVKELFLELHKLGMGLIISSHQSLFDDMADEVIKLG